MKRWIAVLLISVLLLAGCAGESQKSAGSMDDTRGNSLPAAAPRPGHADGLAEAPAQASPATQENAGLPYEGAKIIRTLYYSLRTSTYDEDRAALAQLLSDIGGYEEYAEEYAHGAYGKELRSVQLVLRVPSERFVEFQTRFEAGRNIRSKQLSQEDVTSTYVDTQARIGNLRARVARYREMIAQAEDMADIIEIERALSDATYELEMYESQKAGLDKQIDFSRVTIDMMEVDDPLQVSAQDSFLIRLKEGFVQGINSFIEGVQNIVIFLASNLLWIVLLFGILALLRALRRVLPLGKLKIRKQKSAPAPAQKEETKE